ncbi:MAG: hypothetical protein KDA93_01640 [Planctomycetaceae bacterium]|nr:hypothetical protein [Planctomycetaceae bacterium]
MWEVARGNEVALITYVRRRDEAAQAGFSRTMTGASSGFRRESVEVRLTTSDINEEIDPSTFSDESFGLQNGDYITVGDHEMRLVQEDGERVPPVDDNPKSSTDWYPEASTSPIARPPIAKMTNVGTSTVVSGGVVRRVGPSKEDH